MPTTVSDLVPNRWDVFDRYPEGHQRTLRRSRLLATQRKNRGARRIRKQEAVDQIVLAVVKGGEGDGVEQPMGHHDQVVGHEQGQDRCNEQLIEVTQGRFDLFGKHLLAEDLGVGLPLSAPVEGKLELAEPFLDFPKRPHFGDDLNRSARNGEGHELAIDCVVFEQGGVAVNLRDDSVKVGNGDPFEPHHLWLKTLQLTQ